MTTQSLERWHLHRILLPRRSITGKLLWGTVWRRFDGRRWIYKRFIPPAAEKRGFSRG